MAASKIKLKLSLSDKRWSIAALFITIVFAFLIQSFLDSNLHSETVQANMLKNHSTAHEAFKINQLYDVSTRSTEGYYIAPGETEAPVFSFAIQTFSETLTLNEIKVNVFGDIDPDKIKKLQLFEEDNIISKAYSQKENKFVFKNFTSVLQPNSYKEYVIKLDIDEEISSGTRFKFSVQTPYDITLKKGNVPVHSLDTYPLKGSYVTVLGWRR